MKMPHAVTRPSRVSDRLAEVQDLQTVVDDQLYDLMDDSAGALFDNSQDLTAEDATFWYCLFLEFGLNLPSSCLLCREWHLIVRCLTSVPRRFPQT